MNRTGEPRRSDLVFASILGVVTLAGWALALWLVLVAPNPQGSNEPAGLSCGAPAFFSETSLADSITYRSGRNPHTTYPADTAQSIASDCVSPVQHRINEAVGVTVATAPIAAAWLWLAMVIRTDRLLREHKDLAAGQI